MKKLLIAIFILGALPASAYFEPQWSDFCPARYVNMDINKKYKTKPAKYWALRKKEFIERKNYCSIQKDKETCYRDLREYEINKTQLYYSELNSNLNKMNLIKSF